MVKSAKGGSADAPQKAAANAVHKQSTKKSGATSKGGTGTAASPEKRKQAAAPATSAAAVPSSGGEIDDLFGKLKGKGKAAAAAAEATKTAAAAAAAGATPAVDAKLAAKQARPKRVEGSKDDIFGTEQAEARKRTEEGYAIYSEGELGLGKAGGNTDKCPFDCECCY
ncbi:hypothetical protein D9Q98_008094 [Chlorella vulgaris]|uniref:DUF1764-domain-containing protein n=1 Tax=Chlorella vulgaris TaxID=3077 RepID=A0A9D4YT82_CHLVU|nr:hypothetical protein D9Q98_008094 [Chlorella vulgaris]